MKFLASLFITSLFFISASWETNFKDAKTEAAKNNKYILINFSGSDWCLPCIQLKKKIFGSDDFINYANANLVLVNADFPRQNKHKLDPDQKKQNEDLAGLYDAEGKFPYTVLIDSDGRIIHQWDGLPDVSPAGFVEQLKEAVNKH